jgi:hypothetical protein
MKTTQKNKRPKKNGPAIESLEERVHRHLNDITSVITEEDIRNVKTISTETGENNKQEPVGKETKPKKSRKQKGNEIDIDEKHTTPWDILSEGYD